MTTSRFCMHFLLLAFSSFMMIIKGLHLDQESIKCNGACTYTLEPNLLVRLSWVAYARLIFRLWISFYEHRIAVFTVTFAHSQCINTFCLATIFLRSMNAVTAALENLTVLQMVSLSMYVLFTISEALLGGTDSIIEQTHLQLLTCTQSIGMVVITLRLASSQPPLCCFSAFYYSEEYNVTQTHTC